MNTEQTFETVTSSGAETEMLGEKIGRSLKGGEIFELIGDLGAGKTSFVKGLARGMGVIDEVTSPSFTVNNVYKSPNLSLQHFDFYRIAEAGVLSEEFKEAVFDPGNVIAVEWGNVIHDILPATRVRVDISQEESERRRFVFLATSNLLYVLKELQS